MFANHFPWSKKTFFSASIILQIKEPAGVALERIIFQKTFCWHKWSFQKPTLGSVRHGYSSEEKSGTTFFASYHLRVSPGQHKSLLRYHNQKIRWLGGSITLLKLKISFDLTRFDLPYKLTKLYRLLIYLLLQAYKLYRNRGINIVTHNLPPFFILWHICWQILWQLCYFYNYIFVRSTTGSNKLVSFTL